MRALHRLFTRLLNFTARRRGDERLREEIESHMAAQAEEYVRGGAAPEEARRRARLKFGAVEAVREECRAEAGLPLVENLLLDVRHALRALRKSPSFTIVALFTLALGIGANIVVFGVLNAVLLHPLEVSDPQSLYQLRPKAWISGRLLTTSYPAFEDFQQRNATFSGMAAFNAYSKMDLTWRGAVLDLSGDKVTGNYFDLLGVKPEAGRFFHAADVHGPNSAPYLVLSDRVWRSAFDADRSVIGATEELNRQPFTVIGVAPPWFHGTERFARPDYWMPMADEGQVGEDDALHNRAQQDVTVIGRLKPGVTPQQATENLDAIAARLAKEHPATDTGLPVRLIHPGLFGDDGDVIRGFLYGVTVLALLVLAAACANLASLFAARAADRSRELALRVALGSSRWRLMRQLLTEAVLVSLMGGAAALAGAVVLLGMLNRWELHLAASVDARVYLAGLALSLGSALLFGTVPARQAWQSSPLQAMKGGTMEATHLRRFALRDLLLGAQIAICTLLVTASLVAVRGMVQVLHGPLGIQPQGVMLAGVDLSEVGQEGDAALEKEKEMLEAARSIPGVTAAGAASDTPMDGWRHETPVYRPGTTVFTLNNSVLATYAYSVSPEYLKAAGTRLLGGRDVAWQDTTKTPYVAIVNATFARRMWGKAPAMGQHFLLLGNLTEVVGVAEDGKYHDVAEMPHAAVYLPLSQSQQSDVVFVVRSRRAPSEMAGALRHTLSDIGPHVSITPQSWLDTLGDVLFPGRAATVALGVLGLLAAMLAVTGIFGMAAYSVSQRMKELGIRVALGARKMHVMSAAVARPIVLLGVGSVLGFGCGTLATPLLGRIVYKANPRDPLVLAAAVATMALLGAIATCVPARRALKVDPAALMREE